MLCDRVVAGQRVKFVGDMAQLPKERPCVLPDGTQSRRAKVIGVTVAKKNRGEADMRLSASNFPQTARLRIAPETSWAQAPVTMAECWSSMVRAAPERGR